ncbi:MAG: deoxyribodipyrimidine photo-lyase [Candidatus Limnocylindrales bacterium]
MAPSPTSIAWLRRDLRLHDHPALLAAADAAAGGHLVVLYVLDPVLLAGRWSSPNRNAFLLDSLGALDRDLRSVGSRLHVRVGNAPTVVPALAAEVRAASVHVTADVAPYARRRDDAVERALRAGGVALQAHPGLLVHEPASVLTRDGRPYTVFSPYRRTWEAAPLRAVMPAPPRLPPPPASLPDPGIPVGRDLGLVGPTARPGSILPAGEAAARARLAWWLAAGLHGYADTRNALAAEDGTSRLSQDLRFGLLSATEVVTRASAAQAGPGRSAWLAELCWRDFYLQLLAHHPRVLREPFRAAFERFPWTASDAEIEAWQDGRTGFPIVDAAMRQLGATGYMPNRARMVVASFLAKDLRADWRRGEAHFMRHLVDGEPASNDGGWQWSASTGTDAQPWFRVFDPVAQGRRFDADGEYVRRWLPELAHVPAERIHEPWRMTAEEQAGARCRIGTDYPAPMVDHRLARMAWLEAVREAGLRAGDRSASGLATG